MRDRIGNTLIRLGRRIRRTKFAAGGLVVSNVTIHADAADFVRQMRRAKGEGGVR